MYKTPIESFVEFKVKTITIYPGQYTVCPLGLIHMYTATRLGKMSNISWTCSISEPTILFGGPKKSPGSGVECQEVSI